MRYEKLADWLEWQEHLHPLRVDLGLERVRAVADYCGLLPVKPPVITVAGTNGKGSTVAFLESILRCQGYRVASYTSPHLQRYNERICTYGTPIEDYELCSAFDFIDRHRRGISLSFFEFGTLAALYHFARRPLDVILLEAGLGGRLDAVNIVEPDVSIITSIGIDHTEWLGEDREAIATEKAGIMRYNKPVVCGDTEPPKAISAIATEKGALLYQLHTHFFYRGNDDSYSFYTKDQTLAEGLPRPGLFGEAQLRNTATALMALHCLREQLPVDMSAIAKGLESVQLKGRFQVKTGPKDRIFDIAHNPHGARVLADNLCKSPCQGRTRLVFAALADKDIQGIFREVAPLVDFCHITELNTGRAMRMDDLEKQIQACDKSLPLKKHTSVRSACQSALADMIPGDRLVVSGSMITVAEALSAGI